MNKVVKTMLITVAINLLAGALFLIPAFTSGSRDGLSWALGALVVVGGGLLVELVVGIILAAGNDKRQTGQGLLLAVGVTLLIGFVVCSGMAFLR